MELVLVRKFWLVVRRPEEPRYGHIRVLECLSERDGLRPREGIPVAAADECRREVGSHEVTKSIVDIIAPVDLDDQSFVPAYAHNETWRPQASMPFSSAMDGMS